MAKKDLMGKVFGHWTVVAFDGKVRLTNDGKYQHMWKCRCACGTERIIDSRTLRTADSCGCIVAPFFSWDKSVFKSSKGSGNE